MMHGSGGLVGANSVGHSVVPSIGSVEGASRWYSDAPERTSFGGLEDQVRVVGFCRWNDEEVGRRRGDVETWRRGDVCSLEPG